VCVCVCEATERFDQYPRGLSYGFAVFVVPALITILLVGFIIYSNTVAWYDSICV
jgi:uncharacterized membrane protein